MSDTKPKTKASTSTYRKKMIEVALPLQAINKASAREKSIRHGHPSTLHLWWARRPLAACRAVLFSSLVNDPSDDPMYGISEETAATERAKLFDLIEELVLWENSNNPDVINRARLEIARSIAANKVADGELDDDSQLVAIAPELPEEQAKYVSDPPPEYTPHDVRFKMPGLKLEQVNHFLTHYAPPVLDPFAGGGSIPLEAQRLGLRAYASDLNPVPVLINKALIELPPRFAGQPPVHPVAQKDLEDRHWTGAHGLAEDVRFYGKWMREEAEKRIGHLYPKVKVTQQMVDDGRPDLKLYVGQELTVIAWLWARTVQSPDPALGDAHVPLARSFWLSKKKGKEVFVRPEIASNSFKFRVFRGLPQDDYDPDAGLVNRRGGTCLFSQSPMPFTHIREEGQAGRMGKRLMAIVAEGKRGRVYFDPFDEHVAAALSAEPSEKPDALLPENTRDFKTPNYGMRTFGELFSKRQLVALETFSNLVAEVKRKIKADGDISGCVNSDEYSKAVATYLAFATSRASDAWSTIVSWRNTVEATRGTFARQAIPMVWDYAEANPFSDSCGNWEGACLDWVWKAVTGVPASQLATVRQADATSPQTYSGQVISCDPPYYDNIGYADLSDFFYVWLRRSLREQYPDLLGTMLTPKTEELIACPYRHDRDRRKAAEFFEKGLSTAIGHWQSSGNPDYPTTIFYAFKQSETDSEGTTSTGWETFLEGIIKNGFQITATWPVRTEKPGRVIGLGSNVLASSIVLACVPRNSDVSMVTRRDFANALRKELPDAIKHLQSGNFAPVDLAQASIGPGMGVFSRYSKVVNADGSPMSVREALQLINQVLDESLVEQESDFDAETRFALRWFEQYGMKEGPFGDANTLANALALSVNGVKEAGIAKSGAGKVRLFKREELPTDWLPQTDTRLTMWESTQHLIRRLETEGETRTAELLVELLEHKGSEYAESARELSYRLYQTCERAKRADEARSYNGLVVAWPEIFRLAMQIKQEGSAKVQGELL